MMSVGYNGSNLDKNKQIIAVGSNIYRASEWIWNKKSSRYVNRKEFYNNWFDKNQNNGGAFGKNLVLSLI